jgi:phosphosulfolactate synthase
VEVNNKLVSALLDLRGRTQKPRENGLTIVIDKGQLGPNTIKDFVATAGPYCDCVKIAWGSALITPDPEEKLSCYRAAGIGTMFGGTLFEYAYLRNKTPLLLDLARELKVDVEISDGVIELPRSERLHWIERFAAHVDVFSEIGGKIARQNRDWKQVIAEDRAAGAKRVVVEGREVGPVGQEIRVEFVETLLNVADPKDLIFEAFERKQQIWFIKRLGVNVNLANIPPTDLLTLESFRLGLKEHTLLHAWEQSRSR